MKGVKQLAIISLVVLVGLQLVGCDTNVGTIAQQIQVQSIPIYPGAQQIQQKTEKNSAGTVEYSTLFTATDSLQVVGPYYLRVMKERGWGYWDNHNPEVLAFSYDDYDGSKGKNCVTTYEADITLTCIDASHTGVSTTWSTWCMGDY